MNITKEVYRLLKKIAEAAGNDFSGVGIIVYDEDVFDENRHCDLRPDVHCPHLHVADEQMVTYLLGISAYGHALHDGFHMVNKEGYLTHVAQYFVPPIVKELSPNQEHGVRLYSSMCGSMIEGVLFIGMISSNNQVFLFVNGEYLDINALEVENK